MTEQEVKRLIAMTLGAFPSYQDRDMRPTMLLWHKMFCDYPFQAIEAALIKVLSTAKYWPSVADIIEQAQNMVEAATGERPKDQDEAWQEVQKAVRYTLAFHEPEFSTPQIKQAVETLGWRSFVECESDSINTLRAQFRGVYESICKRRKDNKINQDVLRLIGGQVKQIGGKHVLQHS